MESDESSRPPDESTILRFRHLLEKHELSAKLLATINATLAKRGLLLKAGTVVDATLIAAICGWHVDSLWMERRHECARNLGRRPWIALPATNAYRI
jgi:IS5 family transposase